MFIEAIYREVSGSAGSGSQGSATMTVACSCPRGALAVLRHRPRHHGCCGSRSRTRSGWSADGCTSGCADSISPARGYLSSPRIGVGVWSRRRRATSPAFRSAPEGRKAAQSWDLAADNASGNQCKAFGVGGIMRVARTDPHLVAGRPDAEAGVRRRHADPAAEFRSHHAAARREDLAGILAGPVGRPRSRARCSGDGSARHRWWSLVTRGSGRRRSGSSRRSAATSAE